MGAVARLLPSFQMLVASLMPVGKRTQFLLVPYWQLVCFSNQPDRGRGGLTFDHCPLMTAWEVSTRRLAQSLGKAS